MDRIRINVRGVSGVAWDQFKLIRAEEQICLGRLVTEALEAYAHEYFEGLDDLDIA